MSVEGILEDLRGIGFFSGIGDEHLTRLAEIAESREFPAHAEVFHESDLAKDVYVIVEGEVSLIICAPKVGCRQLTEVGAGHLIGWSPLVGRPRLSDTARTLSPTRVIAIDGERLLNLCREDTEFGFQFMHRTAQVLGERLSATRMQLLDMSGMRLPDYQIESD